jgi:hypothetical protein
MQWNGVRDRAYSLPSEDTNWQGGQEDAAVLIGRDIIDDDLRDDHEGSKTCGPYKFYDNQAMIRKNCY